MTELAPGNPDRGEGAAHRASLLPILAVVCCGSTGVAMVWSVLALYVQSLGGGAALAGMMIGAFGGARLLINVPAGLASERFGRRPLILIGLLLMMIGALLAPIGGGWLVLFLSFLVQGAGSAVYSTAALAAVAEHGTPATRVADMASYQGAHLIGLSVGPAIGGFIAARLGYEATFLVLAGMTVPALMAVSFIGPDRKAVHVSSRAATTEAAISGRATMIVLLVLAYALSFARIGATWVLLPIVASTAMGLDAAQIGVALMVGALANVAILPLTPPINRWLGRRVAIVASNLMTAIGMVLLGFSTSIPSLWTASALLGLGTGFAVPTVHAYATDISAGEQMGKLMGLMRTMLDLGMLTAPFLVGVFIEISGLAVSTALVIATLIFLLPTGALLVVDRRG